MPAVQFNFYLNLVHPFILFFKLSKKRKKINMVNIKSIKCMDTEIVTRLPNFYDFLVEFLSFTPFSFYGPFIFLFQIIL